MIRVLHYGMSPNLGGIEMFVMNLYRNIDKSKIQFDFLTFCDDIFFAEEIKQMGGKIYRLTSRKENIFKNYKELKDFFQEHDEHTILHYHINTCSYLTPVVIFNKKEACKIIIHSHNDWKGKSLITQICHKINRLKINTLSNDKIACSKKAGNWLYGNESDFKIINNGIDLKKFTYDEKVRIEKRKELKIEDKIVIGHVGRFDFQKNHEFLIDIFKEVFNKNKNVVLMLIGTGELRLAIEEKVSRLGLSQNVIFMGMREDISDLLQAMDVFLFPSLFEGLGIVLIEAQAASIPCIVADTIPKEAMITDLIYSVSLNEKPEIWAKIVLEQMNNKRKNRRKEIQDSGYDIESTVGKIEELYLML